MNTAGVNPSSILLRDGDLVRVCAASDAKAFVPGEVPRPATLALTNGRRIQVKRLAAWAALGARRIRAEQSVGRPCTIGGEPCVAVAPQVREGVFGKCNVPYEICRD
ncbi:sugar transporter [Burkholderia contaminans]|uniref:Sugar transporter n=1 Tax=Burkholderia contaminans TaxID=488447 RepID=A0A6P2W1I3_9BURK|nr:sugar transporter [Burkholderia contaminans]